MSYNKAIFTKDFHTKSITIEKTFNAKLERVWEYYTVGEKLAQWWGPETWPATSVSSDFSEGGHWHYYMQGPDGTRAHGYLDYVKIEPLKMFQAIDSFCSPEGVKDTNLPTTNWLATFQETDGKTKVTIVTTYASSEDMQKIVEMGFEEGFTSAMHNLDKIFG